MIRNLILFPQPSRRALLCQWYETGNPQRPLACKWVASEASEEDASEAPQRQLNEAMMACA